MISAFGAKKNTKPRLNGYAGLRLGIFVLVVIFVHLSFRQAYVFKNQQIVNSNEALLIVGFIVFLLGLLLAVWARLYLGKNWGMPMTKKQNPELVTTGPYRFIRHPIYTGILLAMIGSALAISLYWLIPLVIAGSYFIYSATVEEKNMANEFPEIYLNYKKKTKMLIPFIF
ncbi:MAG TPA: isoprenylcysteine carboxylmethyltransferase family protein [Candidatus Saccharimonadales bacterium]|jgi:protein-S-isoprenylcysteine O-methyltransferase Ste14|nr:isoprenylcysteine carboxylmethyltransferase family protein [Candidatus Saccharimonadales bacterium]